MSPAILIFIYCVLVALASLVGGWLPSLVALTHLRQQLILSFVSGVMLGVALLHMLPQSAEYLPSAFWAGVAMLAGLLVMFFLLRVFLVHVHDASESHQHPDDHACGDPEGKGDHIRLGNLPLDVPEFLAKEIDVFLWADDRKYIAFL